MKKNFNILKLFSILISAFTLVSCGKESLYFENMTKLTESKTPVNQVESFMVNNDTPEDVMILNKDSEGLFKSAGVFGYNWSGNLSGPSSIKLSFDKENQLIVVETKNTTGSVYTGYETWEDTYYLSFEEVWSYKEDDEEKGEYYGIGLKKNPKSLNETSDYTGNIFVYKDNPNVLKIMVFGGGESEWKVSGALHFKEKTLLDEFNKLRDLIAENEE